ncbi:hypothetical protein ACE939_08665 [Aquimarina sp. W85]|uniref:hypothetical protein n=1 Tax=Aquimarina rhodophyticola TaxID=3342246 RepID=UPI003670BFE8
MNTEKTITFRKKRELGDVINDTFSFLRNHFKPLLSILFKTALIPFLLALVATGYYTQLSSKIFNPGGYNPYELGDPSGIFIAMLFLFITMVLFYSVLFSTVLHYIKAYIKDEHAIDANEIKDAVADNFLKFLGLGILSSLLMGFGAMLCVLPGIYFYVPVSLVFAIMVFEGGSITDVISRSFELIKGEWWVTFGTLLVVGVLISLIGLVFSVPAMIYTFSKGFVAASESSYLNPSDGIDWVYIVLNSVASAAQYLLYSITAVASALIYFNLHEKKYHTGVLEEIDSIGKNSDLEE